MEEKQYHYSKIKFYNALQDLSSNH